MIYLVDGHNLIPKIPGFSLREMDDEQRLIEMLQKYARLARKRIEIYFDDAPAGKARSETFGTIKVHFIRIGSTADAAIINRVRSAGKDVQAITVVTSDHRIQIEARAMHAGVVSSEEFSMQIRDQFTRAQQEGAEEERPLSVSEVEDWLEFFEQRKAH